MKTTIEIIVLCLLSAEVGWIACWMVSDKFLQVQRKLTKDALEGWGQSLDSLEKAQKFITSLTPKKEKDGSMVSPIQMSRPSEEGAE